MIIRRATDPIAVKALLVLLYGQPGMKKSSWAFTANRPLMLDFDDGVKRMNAKYRKDYSVINQWSEAEEIFQENLAEFDTIILDTVGKALDMLANNIMQKNYKLRRADGELSIQGYGVLKSVFKEFLLKLRRLGKTVILVCHDKESKDGDTTIIRPDITGQSMGTVIRDADLVGYMRSHNKNATVTFAPADNFYGKNSCGLPDNMDILKTSLADVIEKGLKNMNDDSELQSRYLKQLENLSKGLATVEDENELNEYIETLKNIKWVSDARLQIGVLLKQKVIDLNLVFDKNTKLYAKSADKVQAGN